MSKESVLGLRSSPAVTDSLAAGRSGAFAWRLFGWFGLLFTVIGVSDIALVFYPFRPGNPTWEFGAVDLAFSTLPVLTIGFAALLGSSVALARRRTAIFLGVIALLIGIACLGAYVVFLTDVPIALRNTPPEVTVGIKKAVARNTVFAVAFGTAYIGSAIATLRRMRKRAAT